MSAMEDLRFGAAIRAARVRRGLTQRDVARLAGVSDASVSRLERGRFETMSLATIRAIAKVLEVAVELLPRSRAAEVERVVAGAHAALGEAVAAWFGTFAGWVIRPEVGFSNYGDRGVIDLVAWHAARRILVVIELKTELVDINDLLGALDRYARNASVAVAPFGWLPLTVARLLIVGDSDHNRTRVRDHAALFAAALPDRVAAVRRWLREPAGELRGLIFFANRHPRSTNRRFATVRRVRRAQRVPAASTRRAAEHESRTAGAALGR